MIRSNTPNIGLTILIQSELYNLGKFDINKPRLQNRACLSKHLKHWKSTLMVTNFDPSTQNTCFSFLRYIFFCQVIVLDVDYLELFINFGHNFDQMIGDSHMLPRHDLMGT
jgi:hypothetical protein